MIPKPRTLTLFAAGATFALAAYIHTMPAGRLELLPFFVLEAATFGAGTAFLALGWPHVRDSLRSRTVARVGYVSVAWVLLTWAGADAMRAPAAHQGLDPVFGLHAYHASLILAGVGLACYVRALVRERNALLLARTGATFAGGPSGLARSG